MDNNSEQVNNAANVDNKSDFNEARHREVFEDWIIEQYADANNSKIVYQTKYDLCLELLEKMLEQASVNDKKYLCIKPYVKRHKLTLLNLVGNYIFFFLNNFLDLIAYYRLNR